MDCTDCMNCKDYDCCTSPQKTLTEFEKACHIWGIVDEEEEW